MQKGEQLQFENMKINAKRRWVATWKHETNAKRMGVDWKQEDQMKRTFYTLKIKTPMKRRGLLYLIAWKHKDQCEKKKGQ